MAGIGSILYSQSAFQGYISQLQAYVAQLEKELATAQQKEQELGKIWSDEQGAKYRKQIAQIITACQNAIADTNLQIASYQATVKEMEGVQQIGDAAGSAAASAVSKLEL